MYMLSASRCLNEGRGLVIAANKSDLVGKTGVSAKQYEEVSTASVYITTTSVISFTSYMHYDRKCESIATTI